ncbi:hypothetical protein EJB05_20625, partial [Eragrostis curvula]
MERQQSLESKNKRIKRPASRSRAPSASTVQTPAFKVVRRGASAKYDSTRSEFEIDAINTELEGLYKKVETTYRQKKNSMSRGRVESSTSSKDTSSSLASVVSSGFQSFLQSNATECSKSELLIYLDEQNVPIDDKDFKLLDYWKVNAHRFPVVSKLAKKFLVVPASSVSSESTFSEGGRILDDYRSSLSSSMVQALVCASSWIRGADNDINPPILVEEDNEDDVESVLFPESVVASS